MNSEASVVSAPAAAAAPAKTAAPTTPKPTQAHKALARTYYLAKGTFNAAKKIADHARQELLVALDAAGVEEFDFETTDAAGEKLRLEVEVATPDKELIDVKLLKEQVDEATFLRIITASKKDVEKLAGKSVELKCTKVLVGKGTRNVSVDPKS
jgi:hypothetical protein